MITEKKCVLFLSVQNDKIQHHNSSLTDLQYSPSSTQIRRARMGEFFSSDKRSRKCSSMSSTIPSHCKIKIWIRKKIYEKNCEALFTFKLHGAKFPTFWRFFPLFFHFLDFLNQPKKNNFLRFLSLFEFWRQKWKFNYHDF